ncbi:hypothetical protein PR048_018952 [Dryococelus australis]|uniref:Uncharacterized protein n=1 Tax=Dryococelus australis TaxID=614101 RepID=A0ABQ9H273_9NEOP|nr:hypothetical protein PR048_018952 [Dryococelus australis]
MRFLAESDNQCTREPSIHCGRSGLENTDVEQPPRTRAPAAHANKMASLSSYMSETPAPGNLLATTNRGPSATREHTARSRSLAQPLGGRVEEGRDLRTRCEGSHLPSSHSCDTPLIDFQSSKVARTRQTHLLAHLTPRSRGSLRHVQSSLPAPPLPQPSHITRSYSARKRIMAYIRAALACHSPQQPDIKSLESRHRVKSILHGTLCKVCHSCRYTGLYGTRHGIFRLALTDFITGLVIGPVLFSAAGYIPALVPDQSHCSFKARLGHGKKISPAAHNQSPCPSIELLFYQHHIMPLDACDIDNTRTTVCSLLPTSQALLKPFTAVKSSSADTALNDARASQHDGHEAHVTWPDPEEVHLYVGMWRAGRDVTRQPTVFSEHTLPESRRCVCDLTILTTLPFQASHCLQFFSFADEKTFAANTGGHVCLPPLAPCRCGYLMQLHMQFLDKHIRPMVYNPFANAVTLHVRSCFTSESEALPASSKIRLNITVELSVRILTLQSQFEGAQDMGAAVSYSLPTVKLSVLEVLLSSTFLLIPYPFTIPPAKEKRNRAGKCRWSADFLFLGDLPFSSSFIPAMLRSHLTSPSSALQDLAQISSLLSPNVKSTVSLLVTESCVYRLFTVNDGKITTITPSGGPGTRPRPTDTQVHAPARATLPRTASAVIASTSSASAWLQAASLVSRTEILTPRYGVNVCRQRSGDTDLVKDDRFHESFQYTCIVSRVARREPYWDAKTTNYPLFFLANLLTMVFSDIAQKPIPSHYMPHGREKAEYQVCRLSKPPQSRVYSALIRASLHTARGLKITDDGTEPGEFSGRTIHSPNEVSIAARAFIGLHKGTIKHVIHGVVFQRFERRARYQCRKRHTSGDVRITVLRAAAGTGRRLPLYVARGDPPHPTPLTCSVPCCFPVALLGSWLASHSSSSTLLEMPTNVTRMQEHSGETGWRHSPPPLAEEADTSRRRNNILDIGRSVERESLRKSWANPGSFGEYHLAECGREVECGTTADEVFLLLATSLKTAFFHCGSKTYCPDTTKTAIGEELDHTESAYKTSKRHNKSSKFALPIAMHFSARWPPDAPTPIAACELHCIFGTTELPCRMPYDRHISRSITTSSHLYLIGIPLITQRPLLKFDHHCSKASISHAIFSRSSMRRETGDVTALVGNEITPPARLRIYEDMEYKGGGGSVIAPGSRRSAGHFCNYSKRLASADDTKSLSIRTLLKLLLKIYVVYAHYGGNSILLRDTTFAIGDWFNGEGVIRLGSAYAGKQWTYVVYSYAGQVKMNARVGSVEFYKCRLQKCSSNRKQHTEALQQPYFPLLTNTCYIPASEKNVAFIRHLLDATSLSGSTSNLTSIRQAERGGAVLTHWTRIREDPVSIPGPTILMSVFHGFPKITPGECCDEYWDGSPTKATADSFSNLSSPRNLHPALNETRRISGYASQMHTKICKGPALNLTTEFPSIKLLAHAVGRENCTSVQSLAISGDDAFDARGSVAIITHSFLGLKREK